MSKNMETSTYCLAIETSCDDTSIAVLEYMPSGSFKELVLNTRVLSSVVSSQVDIHAQYGGVVPEIGARQHATNILGVLRAACDEVSVKTSLDIDTIYQKISLIAVTTNPGLSSALKVGVEEAKAIQYFLKTKYNHTTTLQEVNHLHGHIASAFLEQSLLDAYPFPHLHLLVSGGNSQILYLKSWNDFNIIGKTLDDAVGECLDKTARMLGIRYPGGVTLAKISDLEDDNYFSLNKSMVRTNDYNFSFSGLKTQVRYICQEQKIKGYQYEQYLSDEDKEILLTQSIDDIRLSVDLDPETQKRVLFLKRMCISIQSIAIEQLVRKMKKAYKDLEPTSVGLSGGVSANLLLREKLQNIHKHNKDKPKAEATHLYKPHLKYTGDNAAMIGFAAILSANLGTLEKL